MVLLPGITIETLNMVFP